MNLWRIVKPYLFGGAGVGLLVAGILLGGECSAWRQDHPKPPAPTPQHLEPTPAELDMARKLEECLRVQALQPTPKERERIAKDSGRPEFARPPVPPAPKPPGAGQPLAPEEIGPQIAPQQPDYPVLLAEKVIPPMPDGGKLWSWLEMDGSNTLVIKPNEPKPAPEERFWSFSPVYELGAVADLENLLASEVKDWKAWGAVEFGRAGRIRPKFQLEGESRGGERDLRAWVGGVWRSR